MQWYRQHARDLPWRRTKDPYAIWLSEIMLQQTQVETVIDYYQRFLKRLPTVEKMARARQDTILKLWEGLGYYSRARNAHKAAKQIVSDYDGRYPQTVEELQTLAGIGRYTAGAIASIAFDRKEPVVDGNVIRVLCRVFRIPGQPRSDAVQKQLWKHASALVVTNHPGDFNQALMELGATVCHRNTPNCDACPIQSPCKAYRYKEQAVLPERIKPKPRPRHIVVVGVIYRDGLILIDKRKPRGLLGGLWEFPGGKKEPGESLPQALKREVKEELDIQIRVGKKLTTVDHAYTHFEVQLHVYQCKYLSGTPVCRECTDFKWVRPVQLTRYAFPTANKKIFPAIPGV